MAAATAALELEEEITELALEYRLMSAYTSFVAVDESQRGRSSRALRPAPTLGKRGYLAAAAPAPPAATPAPLMSRGVLAAIAQVWATTEQGRFVSATAALPALGKRLSLVLRNAELRVAYLDLRRATVAQGLSWLLQPFGLEWEVEGQGAPRESVITGDDWTVLAALALRQAGGEPWNAFRQTRTELARSDQVSGPALRLVNRLDAAARTPSL